MKTIIALFIGFVLGAGAIALVAAGNDNDDR